jgi:SAM-dependent methyltransferase
MSTPPSAAPRHAPATLRNREPILAVLRRVLPPSGIVLEIASGTGEHAVFFAASLPALVWQPSDPDPAARASIAAHAAAAGAGNIRPPLALDASQPWPDLAVDAVLCVNMIHIAPWEATEGLMRGAAAVLPPGGPLYLYGPFRRAGRHTADSNAVFDRMLRAQDPRWGVRDLEAVAGLAAAHGFGAPDVVEMPANNLSVTFRRA